MFIEVNDSLNIMIIPYPRLYVNFVVLKFTYYNSVIIIITYNILYNLILNYSLSDIFKK